MFEDHSYIASHTDTSISRLITAASATNGQNDRLPYRVYIGITDTIEMVFNAIMIYICHS